VTAFVELVRSSGKDSKEWKVLIKYKQQTCICSWSNHVELKLAYRHLSRVSSGSFWWVLLPFRSPKPWAPSSSDRLWVCPFPCCWFQRHFQVPCRIAGKCNVINPLPSLFQTVHSDCAQAAVLPEEMQSEASLHLEGALVRYFASAEAVKYEKPRVAHSMVAMTACSIATGLNSKQQFC